MQHKNTSFTWAVATLISLSLGVGVALAMQTESRTVPAGNQFQVTAELSPGSLVASVKGTSEPDPGDKEVEFSVVFDGNGTIVVNGESGPSYEEDGIYIVIVDAQYSQGVWTANIEVIDGITGNTVLYEDGCVLADKPDTIVAEGLSIARLIVSP